MGRRITASADPGELYISGEEMMQRMIELPDWSWDPAQQTYFDNEDDVYEQDAT